MCRRTRALDGGSQIHADVSPILGPPGIAVVDNAGVPLGLKENNRAVSRNASRASCINPAIALLE